MASLTILGGRESDLAKTVKDRLRDAMTVKEAMLDSIILEQTVEIAQAMVAALRAGGKIVFLGNGGSSMDAGHLAAELTGRYAYDRPSLAAISLPDSTAAMTAIGNDYSYSEVFSRQILGLGRPGDIVVGLTTSGTSGNVVRALEVARLAGMVTVALTGSSGGRCADLADYCLQVPSVETPRIQEACMHLGHTICELVESLMFPR